jgi:uncharacterized protein
MAGLRTELKWYHPAMSTADALASLCARYEVQAIYAFGSRAADVAVCVRNGAALDAVGTSDLDLAVLPSDDRTWTAHERATLTLELEDLFSVSRVDLLVLPEAEPFLALEAVRGELLCCRDCRHEAEFEMYVLRRAGDLADFERQRRQLLMGDTVG